MAPMTPPPIPMLALTLALAAFVPAGAQPAAPAPVTEVEGVDIVLPKDPKVVATFPADGASVPGGALVLKIVFDQRMTPEAWSYGRSPDGAFPDCLARPRLLTDQKTYVLLCSAPTNGKFALGVNVAPGFVSAAGRAVPPFVLRFSTNGDVTTGVPRALIQAGLSEADGPIMDWKGSTGIASSPSRETASR